MITSVPPAEGTPGGAVSVEIFPTGRGIEFAVTKPDTGRADLTLFDVRERDVRCLHDSPSPPNARQWLFTCPEPVADIARFAYLSGWWKGEILPLQWEAMDRGGREVRMRTSKNGHGRVLPLDGDP